MAVIILDVDRIWWVYQNIGCEICGSVFQLNKDDLVKRHTKDLVSFNCPKCNSPVKLSYNELYRRYT